MKYKLSQFTSALHINGGYWLYNSLRSIKGFADEEKYTAQIERLLAGELLPEEEISEELKPFCADEILNEAKLAFGMLNYKDTVDDTLRLIVVTTTACNFRCVYCYENHASSLTIDDAFQANLLNAIADYKERYGFKRLIIEWYGGEPLLLYERLLGFTKDLNRWCEQNEILYQYTATTNGYYLTGERYETLCSLGFIRFQVTVDGFRETHNKLRASLRQGEDTWSVIVGNLMDIKASAGKAHILLRANYNFELLSYLEAYLSFLYENFNSEKFQIFFYPIKRWGGEGDADIEILDDSLLLSASSVILKAMTDAHLRSGFYINRLNLFSQICYAGDARSFFINVNGDIQKCSLTPNPENRYAVIGSIAKGRFDFNEAYNFMFCTPDYELMREKGCLACTYLPLCYGLGCPYSVVADKTIKCIKEKTDMKGLIEYDCKTWDEAPVSATVS